MIVVKIGGALATVKGTRNNINREYLASFAKEFARTRRDSAVECLLVFGGGSFGSGAMIDLELGLNPRQLPAVELPIMPTVMLEYITYVTRLFQESGVPVFPLQSGPHFASGQAKANLLELLRSLFDAGVVPALTSDYCVSQAGSWRVVASDSMLVEFAQVAAVDRVVALTNTQGVYERDTSKTIWQIDSSNFEWALSQTGASDALDATGGMRAKLESLLKVSACGVDSAIMDGRNPQEAIQGFISDWSCGLPLGTVIAPNISFS